jgi:soluble lytic murein transglycosylase-like protein
VIGPPVIGVVLLLAVAPAGCSSSDAPPRGPAAAQQETTRSGPPPPRASIPRAPAPLARRLTDTQRSLGEATDAWRERSELGSWPPPRAVTLWALHQQRIHLLLTGRQRLARRVAARLPASVAAHLRATFVARRGLGKITPLTPGRYRTGPPQPAARLLRHYRSAQRRFAVPWPVLAAVNFVESGFGRLRNSSAAGAQGPMQFIPSTWEAYGLGGDVDDPRDAIMGAANYLHASGAPADVPAALYAYNPSSRYVRAVIAYAARIRRDPRAFLSYYSWQVFVRLPGAGTRRITGPRPR